MKAGYTRLAGMEGGVENLKGLTTQEQLEMLIPEAKANDLFELVNKAGLASPAGG